MTRRGSLNMTCTAAEITDEKLDVEGPLYFKRLALKDLIFNCIWFQKKANTLLRLTLVLLSPDMSYLSNNVDPDQMASDSEAICSGSALFVIQFVNLMQ